MNERKQGPGEEEGGGEGKGGRDTSRVGLGILAAGSKKTKTFFFSYAGRSHFIWDLCSEKLETLVELEPAWSMCRLAVGTGTKTLP